MFFGATAAATGKREIEICLNASQPLNKFLGEILKYFPKLSANKLLFSINQQYATGDEILRDGDELAIFTAVSGG